MSNSTTIRKRFSIGKLIDAISIRNLLSRRSSIGAGETGAVSSRCGRRSGLASAAWMFALAILALSLPARAQEDELAKAKRLTERDCKQCHTFNKGEEHGQGPNLFGLIGRRAADAPGFVYSPGIKEALLGKVWDRDLLEQWLTDTIAVAPKAQMVYFQDDPKVRARLIRYLESLKD